MWSRGKITSKRGALLPGLLTSERLLLPSQALVLTTLASNAIVQRARLRMWPGQPLVARAARGKPVSVTYRTGLGHAETEIGKWRAETGSTKPPVVT